MNASISVYIDVAHITYRGADKLVSERKFYIAPFDERFYVVSRLY